MLAPRELCALLGVAALIGLAPAAIGIARADHDMAAMADHGSEVSVGVTAEAASFDTQFYVGSYQGLVPVVEAALGRFAATAAMPLYHLTENGLSRYGVGDASLGGSAVILDRDALHAGAALHLMLPTGSELENFGMGHVMAMSSVWATWQGAPLRLAASAGYARALTGLGGAHDHGPAPLVDPMNMQELTWSAAADVDIGHGLALGGRTRGAAPIGTGRSRLTGGGRVAWGTPRVTTGVELQVGLIGDPFTLRGVLDTALRF
jgi:hypothetical protein